MTTRQEPATIKKYANRRLYDTGRSAYVTFDDLSMMIRDGKDVVVRDADGADITRTVLTQIILDREGRGQEVLPTNFLKELIRLKGSGLEELAAAYLDFCLDAFRRDQDLFGAVSPPALAIRLARVEGRIGRNVEQFAAAAEAAFATTNGAAPPSQVSPPEIESVRRRIEALKAELDRLAARAELLPDPAQPTAAAGTASRGN